MASRFIGIVHRNQWTIWDSKYYDMYTIESKNKHTQKSYYYRFLQASVS